ncbi:protein maelstrom 1 [Eurytemora carolleeae]|uniref:protein maelstrom 1 n=1 Tax=Eurytemora carolleeae TaxID=1294199 RepID=UPI000C77DA12|nr:protein maelstrom 1 [Eurytemora carolleeae]XP_023321033.1 protein maelstrom 1 [Eurytemora carolleeae]|eukprot:XP_023321032.1 protein maelstrom 1-like [Eurytemora affinis]
MYFYVNNHAVILFISQKIMSSNGFISFALEKKKSIPDWRNMSIQEVVDLCSPIWNEMSHDERSRYKGRKKEGKTSSGKDCYGRDLKAVKAENERKKNDPANMMKTIRDLMYRERDPSSAIFTIIHTNIMTKTDSGIYIPAEICVVKFSLKQGVIEMYHDIPHSGTIPKGYTYQCNLTSERTHKIPLDYELSNPNVHSILGRIETMLENQVGEKILYTENKLRGQVQGVLNALYRTHMRSKQEYTEDLIYPTTVLDVATLLKVCRDISLGDNILGGKSLPTLEKILSREKYVSDGISCCYHQDDGTFCSQALALNWVYCFLEDMCPLFNIHLKPGSHTPNPVYETRDEDGDSVLNKLVPHGGGVDADTEIDIDDEERRSGFTGSSADFSHVQSFEFEGCNEDSDAESVSSRSMLQLQIRERIQEIKKKRSLAQASGLTHQRQEKSLLRLKLENKINSAGTKDSLVPDIQAGLENSRDHCNTSSEINCSGSSVEDRVRLVGCWSDSGSYVSASQESSKSNTVRSRGEILKRIMEMRMRNN